LEMHALGVEVGGMQLGERIVCASDLTEEEKSKWMTWKLCRLVDARPVEEKRSGPLDPGSVKVSEWTGQF